MIDMLAGQVSLMFTSTASAAQYVSSGKLRMLAVASLLLWVAATTAGRLMAYL